MQKTKTQYLRKQFHLETKKRDVRNVYYDTSILSRIAWTDINKPLDELIRSWNSFLIIIEGFYPGFCFEDHKWINSDILFLEIIGLGTIKEKDRKKNSNQVFTSRSLNSYTQLIDWQIFNNTEDFIQHLANIIDEFIATELSERNLRRQTHWFQRNYKPHELSHFIFARIKQWRKSLKNKGDRRILRNTLMWDSIFKFPFIDLNKIDTALHARAMKFWAEVIGLMFKEYYEMFKVDVELESSTLGLFAEVHRVGSFVKQKQHPKLLKIWRDMADSEAMHYALVGKRKKIELQKPVIVITCDKAEDVKQRLECQYKNLIEMSQKGLKIPLCPGEIICFKVINQKLKFDQRIIVQDFINTLT